MITQEDIINKYWFFQPDLELKNNLIAFGLECGGGWYPLIDKLCSEIEEYFKHNPDEKEDFQVLQVKEKFGSLRFYITSGTEELYDIIRKYEKLSSITCEVCGNPGNILDIGHWYKAMCNPCYKKLLLERSIKINKDIYKQLGEV